MCASCLPMAARRTSTWNLARRGGSTAKRDPRKTWGPNQSRCCSWKRRVRVQPRLVSVTLTSSLPDTSKTIKKHPNRKFIKRLASDGFPLILCSALRTTQCLPVCYQPESRAELTVSSPPLFGNPKIRILGRICRL